MVKEKSTPCKLPEIVVGIRIEYTDLNEATRTGKVSKRDGNFLTVELCLKERKRIRLNQVKGYWKPRVKDSPKNLIHI